MAGHRRATGEPLQRVTRARSRRVKFLDALGAARTPLERINAAYRYASATAAKLPEPTGARMAADVVAAMQTITDRALTKEGLL